MIVNIVLSIVLGFIFLFIGIWASLRIAKNKTDKVLLRDLLYELEHNITALKPTAQGIMDLRLATGATSFAPSEDKIVEPLRAETLWSVAFGKARQEKSLSKLSSQLNDELEAVYQQVDNLKKGLITKRPTGIFSSYVKDGKVYTCVRVKGYKVDFGFMRFMPTPIEVLSQKLVSTAKHLEQELARQSLLIKALGYSPKLRIIDKKFKIITKMSLQIGEREAEGQKGEGNTLGKE